MELSTHLIATLAKRNIFRNPRRTLLTISLISFCLAALLLADAYIRGSMSTFIKISTETFLGDAQIHQQGFRDANDIDIYITDVDDVAAELQATREIAAFSPRTITGAMLSSSENVSSGLVFGIIGEQEAQVSKLKKAMVKGSYLSGEQGQIIIGTELADLLEIDLGDRLVVTVSQAHGGDLSQELFRVSGLFSFNDRTMDNGIAFINLNQGQQLLNIKGVHQFALRFQSLDLVNNKSLPLWKTINSNGLEILDWKELIPQLSGMLGMVDYSSWIISGIMYVLVSLGLINTMFMSIYERHNEFGILLAIGTRPRQLFRQIMMEGFFIGLISLVVGVALGWALSYWGSIVGFQYANDLEMMGTTLNEPIYLIIDTVAFTELSISILLVTVLASVYPAIHAARLRPSSAMRKAL